MLDPDEKLSAAVVSDELTVAMVPHAAAEHLTVQDIEGGKQGRGAVAGLAGCSTSRPMADDKGDFVAAMDADFASKISVGLQLRRSRAVDRVNLVIAVSFEPDGGAITPAAG